MHLSGNQPRLLIHGAGAGITVLRGRGGSYAGRRNPNILPTWPQLHRRHGGAGRELADALHHMLHVCWQAPGVHIVHNLAITLLHHVSSGSAAEQVGGLGRAGARLPALTPDTRPGHQQRYMAATASG